jgi:REP element-mobilizing transposase RayT
MLHAGWRSRGYIPHFDNVEVVQHVVFSTVGRGEGIAGHFGARLLQTSECASEVQDALLHFDGERYRLFAWCVMPNHVHVLVEEIGDWRLDRVVHSWKSFTANRINTRLDRSGSVWMREYFDRYMRDERHFNTTVAYIEHNPVAAGFVKRERDWDWSSAALRS